MDLKISLSNNMSIKDKYTVRSVPLEATKEWILYKHYARRMPSITYAFGLYDLQNKIHGICTFGNAIPPFMKRSICGKDYEHLVYELNRLCINEGLEKNVLSFFVSKSLLLLPSPLIIISYADIEQGHHGYI